MTRDIIEIDVVSDVMCPWCYVGKRRLEKAISRLPDDIAVDVTWRPFQLDPAIPPQGRDRKKYLEDKFGGEQGAREKYQPIEEAGKKEGIPFNFDGIKLSPNTFDAHRLLHWARAYDRQDALSELLFKAYFVDNLDLTKSETLLDLAEQAGLERDVIARLLASDTDADEVRAELAQFQNMGVRSVPTMIVVRKYAISGAQEADTILDVLKAVHQERQQEKA